MRNILIVGAGQAGLQLAHGLRANDYTVRLVAAQTPDQLRNGWPTSTQGMFHRALETERALGLNLWDADVPAFGGLRLALAAPPANLALSFNAHLEHPGQSVDQRLKMAAWLELAEQRGIEVTYATFTTGDIAYLAAEQRYDLIVVAAGKGDLVSMFDHDPQRSPYTTPQRALAATYVHGLQPDPQYPQPHVGFNAIPGIGELFVIPALTMTGRCDILFWEALPGGPADRWPATTSQRYDPHAQLQLTLDLAREYLPWVHERCTNLELAGPKPSLHGRYVPTVRKPVARFSDGGLALGMADAVIANDPITGQGSNTAAKCAAAYLDAILARGDAPFDEVWMTATFERFWAETGRAVTEWTNALLQPLPPHVEQILGAAASDPVIATRFANGFSDPADFDQWFMSPDASHTYLTERASALAS